MATLYLHIPFCKRICSYCDFYKVGAVELLPSVCEAMQREMTERRAYLRDNHLTSIYFGGGTPSLVEPDTIQRLINHAHSLFDCSTIEEITLEANPDDLTEEYVARLADTSVGRISLGVQSFDDQALRLMNRRHTAHEAEEAVRRLRRAGFENISIDIIFGIAGFGGRSLLKSLQRAIELGAEHISAYHLTIEERTRLGVMTRRGEYHPISDELSEEEYLTVHRALTDAGYDHYEVSNYAREGARALHNSAYWRGVEYLGIGPGAHSFTGDDRRWCCSTAKEYGMGIFRYESESLTPTAHLNEYVMTALRTAEGINLNHIATHFGEEHAERITAAAKRWIASGALLVEGSRMAIPAERFLISDAIIEELFA